MPCLRSSRIPRYYSSIIKKALSTQPIGAALGICPTPAERIVIALQSSDSIGPRSNPNFEHNLTALLKGFRSVKGRNSSVSSSPLIIHVWHSSDEPSSELHHSSPGVAWMEFAVPLPHEPVIRKTVNSAFIGTNLEALLREHEITRLYIAGLSTDHCVSTTTRMAGNLHVTEHLDQEGLKQRGQVILVGDATAAWEKGGYEAEVVHAVHVESLREFAAIARTDEVLEELEQEMAEMAR